MTTAKPTPTTIRWVLGTLDRVRVQTRTHEEILDLHELTRRYGRDALADLYLKGTHTTTDIH